MKAMYLYVVVIGLTVSSCGKASASALDPSNPLHCAAQMEGYSVVARLQGDERTEKRWRARAMWYAERARSLSSDQLSNEAKRELVERITTAPDGGLALATECMKQQERDPDLRRLIASI